MKGKKAIQVTEQQKGTYKFQDSFVIAFNGVCYATKEMEAFISCVPRKVNDLIDPLAVAALLPLYFPTLPTVLVDLIRTSSHHCSSIANRHLEKQRKIIADQIDNLHSGSIVTARVSGEGVEKEMLDTEVAQTLYPGRMVDYCSMINVLDMWFASFRMYHILGYGMTDTIIDQLRLWMARILWEHEPIGECSTMLKTLKKDFDITTHHRNFSFLKKDATVHQHIGRAVYRMSKSSDAAIEGVRAVLADHGDTISIQLQKQSEELKELRELGSVLKQTADLVNLQKDVIRLQNDLERANLSNARLKRTFAESQEHEQKAKAQLEEDLRHEKETHVQKVQKLQDAWRVHIKDKYVRRGDQ
jgi:hypothetical protein